MHTLYFLFEVKTGKVFYVGVTGTTLKRRLKRHRYAALSLKADLSYRYQQNCPTKIRSLLLNNIDFGIESLMTFENEDAAFEGEKKYISWAKRIGFSIVNQIDGGTGHRGLVSEGTRLKLSQAGRGRRVRPDVIEKLREANRGFNNPQFGKSPSRETRAKQRKALVGKKNPGLLDPIKKEIWRKNITDNHADVSGVKNPMYGKSGALAPTSKKVEQRSLDGNLLAVFGSAREASRATGVPNANISRCARGLQETSNGFIWRYSTATL